MHQVTSPLSQRIRKARREAGMRNMETLAVTLGVSMSTAQRWESGKADPSIRRLREIAAVTGKPLSYFLEAEIAA